ncbi:MAG: hypothetical protein ACI9R3_002730 [Verrucomicrobiales bacterium]|jgi:hypothetical protein
MQRRRFLGLISAGVAAVSGLSGIGCSTIAMPSFGGGGGGGSDWVGRRYFTRQTRFWGYVKKPGDAWSKARLVIMNERYKHSPDRLPELAMDGRGHGFDHNYEYRLEGTFSGNEVYDPNSDKVLPEFVLRDYALINKNPEPLFNKSTAYSAYKLPPRD